MPWTTEYTDTDAIANPFDLLPEDTVESYVRRATNAVEPGTQTNIMWGKYRIRIRKLSGETSYTLNEITLSFTALRNTLMNYFN